MEKTWGLIKQTEINNGCDDKKFQVPDKRIELEYSPSGMKYVALIGFLPCIMIMKAGGYVGFLFGIIGMALIYIIGKAFTTKTSKSLHHICYFSREREYESFFAIDINTNELFHIHHFISTDSDTIDGYRMDPLPLDDLKNCVSLRSDKYYEMISNITSKTQYLLKNIQFGETEYRWLWYAKKKVEDKIHIGCFRIYLNGAVSVKYIEFSEQVHDEYMSGYSNLYEEFLAFTDENHIVFEKSDIKPFSVMLTREEIDNFTKVFNGDKTKCKCAEKIQKYHSRDFIVNCEYEDEAYLVDVNGMKFAQHLASKDRYKPFVPYEVVDGQLTEATVTESEHVLEEK